MKTKKYLHECELIAKEWLSASYYKLRFLAPDMARICTPGHFVNFRLSNYNEPLLRRPMSIYRCNRQEGWLEFLIKVVGKGTHAFSQTDTGDRYSLLGPLGQGFDMNQVESAILIGGGIGIAPLVFLAEEMKKNGIEVIFIQGFRSDAELCCVSEIQPNVKELFIVTEDGSYGFQGLVTHQLHGILQSQPELSQSEIFSCGPNPMLRAVEQICDKYKMDAQFSLEAHMACGFGACVGCAVLSKDHQKYYLACLDGPVFHKGEVDLGT